jgi:hypothetical protein
VAAYVVAAVYVVAADDSSCDQDHVYGHDQDHVDVHLDVRVGVHVDGHGRGKGDSNYIAQRWVSGSQVRPEAQVPQ